MTDVLEAAAATMLLSDPVDVEQPLAVIPGGQAGIGPDRVQPALVILPELDDIGVVFF